VRWGGETVETLSSEGEGDDRKYLLMVKSLPRWCGGYRFLYRVQIFV
jgi:hypothetical protein